MTFPTDDASVLGRERNALCARVSLRPFPRERILVVVHKRLHEELVAEQSPIDDLVRLGRAHDVVTPRAGARLDLRLRRDELRRLDVELVRRGLDADARESDLAARTRALASGHEEHVGDAGQVRRHRGTGVRRGLLGAALFRQPLIHGGGPPVLGRRGAEERQLHLQAPHRFAGRVLSRLARELLHQLRVEVAHLHEQCDDRGHECTDRPFGDHVRNELPDSTTGPSSARIKKRHGLSVDNLKGAASSSNGDAGPQEPFKVTAPLGK
jgi:hypothetical protein